MIKKYAVIILAVLMCISAVLVTGCGDKKVKTFIYDPGDAFITNIEGTKYLLKADIVMEISNPKNQKILEQDSVQADVRSMIIEILRSSPYDEIMSADGQDQIAGKIKAKIEEKLQIAYVENIYFNEFVVQH